jgi:hypothetical protein
MSHKLNFIFTSKAKMVTYIMMGIGLISMILGYVLDTPPEGETHYHQTRFWANIFINGFFFMAVGLAAAFFLGLQYAAEAGWATTIKRIIEAVAWYLPWGLGLMLLIFVLGASGVHHIYIWMDADAIKDDAVIQGKIGYFGWFWWVLVCFYNVFNMFVNAFICFCFCCWVVLMCVYNVFNLFLDVFNMFLVLFFCWF